MTRLTHSILMMALLLGTAFGAGPIDSLKPGNAELQSAAQLAFGPNGILFVGDSRQAAVFAIATEDTQPANLPAKYEIRGINERIAAQLGIAPDQLLINDVKVNPLSRRIYIAVSRGRGADSVPVILRLDGSGKISEFSLTNVKYAMVSIPSVPDEKPDRSVRFPEGMANANTRVRSITDLSYIDGKVIVAGMSNEDFASDLRAIPFPFKTADEGTGIRIWHSAHGRYETAAPVDKFIPYMIKNQPYILASYACTPLVKIPVSGLKPGAKVTGTTIAEIGHHNTPLEMFSYLKDGHHYILMAGSTRGVIKISADDVASAKPIKPPNEACEESNESERLEGCSGDIAGLRYETIAELKGVWQMEKLDDSHAIVLADSTGAAPKLVDGQASWFTLDPKVRLDLTTIALP